MPFIYRTLNRFPLTPSPIEHVKQEQHSIEVEEQSMLSGEANAVENKEGNEGRWNEDQNFRFVLFVHYYQEIFASQHKRKVCKIFRTFSEYLTERTAAQCRSHYQKMIIKHKTIAKLKKHYKALYGDKLYAEEFDRFKAQWEITHPLNSKASPEIKEFKEIAIQTEEEGGKALCQNCSGVRSESDLVTSSSSAFKPYVYWDINQLHNPSLTFYYWIPSSTSHFAQ